MGREELGGNSVAGSQIGEESVSVKIAFNTLIYEPDRLGGAISDIKNAMFEGIEIFPKDLDCLSATQEKIGRLALLLKEQNIKVACIMAGFLESEESLHYAQRASDVAAALACDRIFILPPARGHVGFDMFTDLCSRLADYAAMHGVLPVVHHHAGTVVQTLAEIQVLFSGLDPSKVGLCFDCAHYLLFEDDLIGGIRKLGSLVRYVHLKDLVRRKEQRPSSVSLSNVGREFTDLGKGVINMNEVLEGLREIGYEGWLTVEIENRQYPPVEHVKMNSEYLRQLLSARLHHRVGEW